jgi:predicted nucleotidyltransferase component of viral defense system
MTPRDAAASIKAQLLGVARSGGEDLQRLLNRYGRERLLYRLSKSPHRDQFILKGGMLFSMWAEKPFRGTKDADFLSYGPNSVDAVAAVFRSLFDGHADPDDGLRLAPETFEAAEIHEEDEYHGVRVHMELLLGKAIAQVQLDIGFGDAVVPAPEEVELPVLIGFPAPRLRAYPKEAVIAEKLQAMAVLGSANGRMKDFYDLWILQREFSFDGVTLARAIQATFERRKTPVEPESCVAFQASYFAAAAPQNLWSLYVKRADLDQIPPPFASVGEAITGFLRPIAASIADGKAFDRVWTPGGPWRNKEGD